jgi:AcrR family transcriptional regulator
MRDTVRQKTNRDALLDATDKLLSTNGYKKMTIDDLAREVGIGKGSVYLHFESKEELVLSHIDRIVERLKQRLEQISAGKGSCEKRLRSMIVERVLFRFDSVQHYTQSLNDMLSRLRPKLLERRRRYFDEEARIFARILEEGARSGIFNVKRPLHAAAVILDATNSFLPLSLTTEELGERAEIEKKVDSVADLLLNGLIKR